MWGGVSPEGREVIRAHPEEDWSVCVFLWRGSLTSGVIFESWSGVLIMAVRDGGCFKQLNGDFLLV